jgi:hypothetical protein
LFYFHTFVGLNGFLRPNYISAISSGIASGKIENSSVAPHWIGSFRGGPDQFGLQATETAFGGGMVPEETKVAQVLPDSGLYSAVRPGIGGMWIR